MGKMRKVRAPGYKIIVRCKPQKEVEQDNTETIRENGMVHVLQNGLVVESYTEQQYEDKTNRETEASVEAYVVDIGESAFKLESTGDKTPWCEIGDCVVIHKYSGTVLPNMGDSNVYRSIADLDIQAIFPEDKEEVNKNAR